MSIHILDMPSTQISSSSFSAITAKVFLHFLGMQTPKTFLFSEYSYKRFQKPNHMAEGETQHTNKKP